ncbi:sodium:proton antiporter, partial [Marinomonas arenicola]
NRSPTPNHVALMRTLVCSVLLIMAIFSQNLIRVHIAFIPILVPPLLQVMTYLKLDRRLIAFVLTFGLVTPYMVLPV